MSQFQVGGPPQHPYAYTEGWRAAVRLVDQLGEGNLPGPLETPLVLQPGEQCRCAAEVELASYYGQVVHYQNPFFVFGRTLFGMAATAGASMFWSAHNERQAQAQAAAQWRTFGVVPVYVTDSRIFLPLDGRLAAFWLPNDVLVFKPDWHQYVVHVQTRGSTPLALRGPAVPYLSVLLHFLLFHNVPRLPSVQM